LRELFTRRIDQHLLHKNERFFQSRHIRRIYSNCFSLNIVYCRWDTHDKKFSQVCFDCEYFDQWQYLFLCLWTKHWLRLEMNRFDSISIRILLSRILAELKSTQCRFDSIRFRVFSISIRNQSEFQLRYVMIMFCLLILNFAIININICELKICVYNINQCSIY
jgi:hypothetical protein